MWLAQSTFEAAGVGGMERGGEERREGKRGEGVRMQICLAPVKEKEERGEGEQGMWALMVASSCSS